MKLTVTESGMVVGEFGGDGGKEFQEEFVHSIGLRTGKEVDALILNKKQHGGNGGEKREEFILNSDEYINKIVVRSGDRIDYLELATNQGNFTRGGGNGGKHYNELTGIRVVAIGGKSGARLDKLKLTYVKDYTPSEVVERKARFIIGFNPPNTILKEYKEAIYSSVESYERVTQSMISQRYSASVEAEYYAKVSASVEIKYEDSKLETIKRELSQQLKQGTYTEVTIGKNKVGLLLVSANILKHGEEYWIYPVSDLSYAVKDMSSWKDLLDSYDLTGNLYSQVPELKQYRREQNGYTFYGE